MFQATMCPSSGENTVPMRHLLFVTLNRWLVCSTYQTVIYIKWQIPRVAQVRCFLLMIGT